MVYRGVDIVGIQAAGEEDRDVDFITNLSAHRPVVNPTGSAEHFGAERWVAGVEQDRIDGPRDCNGVSDRVVVPYVNHLDDRYSRQCVAQAVVHAWFDVVDQLQRVGAAEPLLRDDRPGSRLTR